MDTYRSGQLTFPVADSGPADGDVVVLLHGFPQDASSLAPVATQLNQHNLRTLVPTQRGYATTNRPVGRRAYRIADLVADVVNLLDAAGVDRVNLVGHDWGGTVAWAFAAWHPDRLHSLTALSTPHPAAMRAAMWRSDQALKSWYMGFFQLPKLPELLVGKTLRRTLSRTGLPPAEVVRYCADMDGRLTGPLNWYRGLPFSQRPPVGKVQVPTTYVWGKHDFALGRKAAELTAEYVTGDYRFVPTAGGHWLPETRIPEVVAAILDRVG